MADNVELQGLEFQITNDSTQAVRGLEKLSRALDNLRTSTRGGTSGLSTTARSLERLSKALSGLDASETGQKIAAIRSAVSSLQGLSRTSIPKAIITRIQELNTALDGMSADNISKLTSIGSGLGILVQAGNGKISSSIATQLTAINTALFNLKWTDGDKLTALANGLRPLSQLGKANLTTFINQLSKLPKVIEDLEAADIDKFSKQMTDLATAMKPFADEMQKVSTGFSSFPAKIQRVIASSQQYNTAVSGATAQTNTWGTALKGLKVASLTLIFRKTAQFLASAIDRASEYLEDVNLFTVSMGEYTKEAYTYAQQVSDIMGIDPAEWMRNQGVFNTIITGFGVAADKAALMSKNLTQLGYDISSFYNISFEDSMQKVQSGIAGELEPLRRIGYDLSVARLQQEAYNLGITKSVSAMTQAEKAQLRYYTMMTQVTQVQGDMARTLEQPTNMIRVLKAQLEQAARAIGDLFIPVLSRVLPIAIAVAQALREIVAAIAMLFGVELQTPDWDNAFGSASVGSGEIADNMEDAASAAKKLKQYTLGFDELNVISPNDGSGSGSGASAGGGLDFDLPEYDFLGEAVTEQIDAWKKKLEPFVTWVKENLDEILSSAIAIGSSILAWKVATSFIRGIQTLKGLMSKLGGVSIGFKVLGIAGFLDSMHRFTDWVKDFINNGATLDNVVGMLTSFAGGVGYALATLGHTKLGGALVLIDGLGEIFLSIRDMTRNGVDIDNVLTMVHGLGNVLTAVGLLTGNSALIGGGFMLTGITTIVEELRKSWDAIKQGDWSDVDIGVLAIGAIETIGGFLAATGVLKGIVEKIGGAKGLTETSTALQGTADAIGGSTGGGLNGSLKNIATNLGWGIAIIAEVSAAAIIIVGAIWILGEELTKVGEAWQPVIDNAGTVATAIGIGAGLLAVVGLATYGLGTLGGTAAVNIGIGTGILVELGVATGVFIAEIWGVGEGLAKVGEAWKPVIEDAPTVKTGIATGTGLLLGIGVVTAALGMATVASVGLLPAAIALGTGILVELAVAFVAFTESLISVADEIGDDLAPALERLNPKLPGLKDDMADFTEYMTDFADKVSTYTKSMGSVTWDSIVSGFRKLFAGDPIADLADDVNDIYGDLSELNDKLKLANPELTLAVQMMSSYVVLMNQLNLLTEQGNDVGSLPSQMFTNLKTVGENLVIGLATGINNKAEQATTAADNVKTKINMTFSDMGTTAVKDWNDAFTAMLTCLSTFQTTSISSVGQFHTSFVAAWSNMWRGVGNVFVGQWNLILNRLEQGLNSMGDALNKFLQAFNMLSALTGSTYTYMPQITVPRIEYMASGGFVDEGQLFVAREAGAEMVGAMGRRTAVANNEQITEGIARATVEANGEQNALLREQNELLRAILEKDTSTRLDGKTLLKSTEKAARQRGAVIMAGGVMG